MNKNIFIITLFPEYFEVLKTAGVVANAFNGNRANFKLITINPRDYSPSNYKGVDDTPFGGGGGMIMRADVLADTINQGILNNFNLKREEVKVVYTAPRGKIWRHELAMSVAEELNKDHKTYIFICGRYEGIDERFLQNYVDEFYSLGDFVLSGGELAVMTILDSSLRLIPGVLGNSDSFKNDSFYEGLIEYPLYTKPREFEGLLVPEVLVGGHHEKIKKFQKEEAIAMTKKHRPDLLKKFEDKK